jgi:hypothetical protein
LTSRLLDRDSRRGVDASIAGATFALPTCDPAVGASTIISAANALVVCAVPRIDNNPLRSVR